MVLQSELEACQAAIVRNESMYTGAQAKAHMDYEREMKFVVQVDARDADRAKRLVEFLEGLAVALPVAYDAAAQLFREEGGRATDNKKARDDEAAYISKRRNERLEEAKSVYDDAKKSLLAQRECLKQVAKLVGVEVLET